MTENENRRSTDLSSLERIQHVEKEVVSLASLMQSQGQAIIEIKELLRSLTNRPVNVVGWVTAGLSLLGALGAGTFIMVQYINLAQQPIVDRMDEQDAFNVRLMDALIEQAEERGLANAERDSQGERQEDIRYRLRRLEEMK
jgi:hypothetical protein